MSTTHIDPLNDGTSSLALVRASGSDLDVVNAARVSYGSYCETMSPRDEKLIWYLISHQHTSPFEHTQLVFRVKAPIYVIRQWMRHRVGVSYNEISGRYVELPLEFYTPQQWRIQDPKNKQGSLPADIDHDGHLKELYTQAITTATASYKALLEAGVCRELARGVLPVCTYSEFIFTCNLISLFHFVKLRADSHAQWEIQTYARGMLELARPHFPVSIQSWERLAAQQQETVALAHAAKQTQTIVQ